MGKSRRSNSIIYEELGACQDFVFPTTLTHVHNL